MPNCMLYLNFNIYVNLIMIPNRYSNHELVSSLIDSRVSVDIDFICFCYQIMMKLNLFYFANKSFLFLFFNGILSTFQFKQGRCFSWGSTNWRYDSKYYEIVFSITAKLLILGCFVPKHSILGWPDYRKGHQELTLHIANVPLKLPW